MSAGPYVFGIRTDEGLVSLCGWSQDMLSAKRLKRLLRRFRRDTDFAGYVQMHYSRFYATKTEMKHQLCEAVE